MKDKEIVIHELNGVRQFGRAEQTIILTNAINHRVDRINISKIEIGLILIYAKSNLELYKEVSGRVKLSTVEINDCMARANAYQKSLELGAEPNEDFLNNSSEAYIKNFNKLPEDKQKEIIEGATREEVERRVLRETADLRKQAKAEKEAKETAQKQINYLKEQNEKLQKDLKDRPSKEVKPADYDELKRQASKVTQLQNQLNARERALGDKERELRATKDQLDAVNNMNLTKREAEGAEAQYKGLSHDIKLMIDVQYKVKDMIAEINKLPISPKFNDDKAVTYRKGTLEVIDNALDCLNELKSKLTPDKQILYSNSDIVEVDYNE